MRFPDLPRLLALPAVVAFSLALFAASLVWQPPAAEAASGPLDAQAMELVRLINGARADEGRPPLSLDPFLASKARDGAIPCPDDATQTIAGRAHDFAAYGTMSHSLRLCDADAYTLSSTKYVSVLQSSWSYWNVGEINLVNGGYGNGAFLYAYGGWQTWTYSTTGHAMMAWKTSSSHWSIIVGTYDRVGCGGWASGSSFYYECSFGQGGSSPNGLRSPPTASPFDYPLPTSLDPTGTPTPQPTLGATPSPTTCGTGTAQPGQGGGAKGGSHSRDSGATLGSDLSSGSPSAASAPGSDSRTASTMLSTDEASAKTTAGNAAGPVGSGGAIAPRGGASEALGAIASAAAPIGGSAAAALAFCYVSFSLLRRRRRGRVVG